MTDLMPAPDLGGFDIEARLDTCGLRCPEPVMMLHGRVRSLAAGAVLELRATDPSTLRDVPKFCDFLGHALVGQAQQDEVYVYLIRKGG